MNERVLVVEDDRSVCKTATLPVEGACVRVTAVAGRRAKLGHDAREPRSITTVRVAGNRRAS